MPCCPVQWAKDLRSGLNLSLDESTQVISEAYMGLCLYLDSPTNDEMVYLSLLRKRGSSCYNMTMISSTSNFRSDSSGNLIKHAGSCWHRPFRIQGLYGDSLRMLILMFAPWLMFMHVQSCSCVFSVSLWQEALPLLWCLCVLMWCGNEADLSSWSWLMLCQDVSSGCITFWNFL